MEAKELWEKACKETLSDIAKAFSDEKNINKAKSESDKVVFAAFAKMIESFPIPECPNGASTETFGADLVIVTGKGTTSATKNKIIVRNLAHNILAEISINDDGSGYSNSQGREWLLKQFKGFFTFHNEANKDYSGIDDLFNKWYDQTPEPTSPFNFIPICQVNRALLEKGRDYFVVTEGGHIIQAHYDMITETEGDFFGKDTNEFFKVVKIDLDYKQTGGHIA